MNDVAALDQKEIEYSMEGELVELGEVSVETKGLVWGSNDGGGGLCFCR